MEIVVVPFAHPGHLFPATELCNQLAARNYKITIFYPSSSSSPPSISLNPLIQIVELPLADSVKFQHQAFDEAILTLISNYFDGRDRSDFPICAIVDEMISWAIDPFVERQIPAVSLYTSSACSSALTHAMHKAISSGDLLTSGKILAVPGLPPEMSLTSASLAARRPHPPGGGPPPHPPTERRRQWRGQAASDGVAAVLFNTCSDLERPFLDYVAREIGRPAWGVGPLLPARLKDGECSRSKRESNFSEREVIEWLDSKPRGSVIYASFGSLVRPADEELAELAAALEESDRPFIWAVQPDAKRHDSTGQPIEGPTSGDGMLDGLGERVGPRGLVVRGWAPQLSILSHPSTGGYVCHCGWNSTVEALACGVPMLTWPVRGDQHHNARMVTDLLRVGLPVKEDADVAVRKGDVVRGMERLMRDEEIKERAAAVKSTFEGGFPKSSSESLDAFLKFMRKK